MIDLSLQDEIRRISRVPTLLIACDFDGTLAPIAPRPEQAVADTASIDLLRKLAALESTHVAIISGRARSELLVKLDLPKHVTLVGGHGAEVRGGPAADPQALVAMAATIERTVADYEGSFVERKPTGIAVHYRQVAAARHSELRTRIRHIAEAAECPLIREGLMVVEAGFFAVHKGDAVRHLAKRVNAQAVLFVGDDVTDEDAFAALRSDDVGIKVGASESVAKHSVRDSVAVREVLESVLEARRSRLASMHLTAIDRLALLSDQRTCALIDQDCRISWMCSPRFDSTPVFGELLGGARFGSFSISPVNRRPVLARGYDQDTFVLRTAFDGLTVTDYMDCSGGRAYQRAGRSDLLRVIEGNGTVRLRFSPRIDFGRTPTRLRISNSGIAVEGNIDPIALRSTGVEWSIERFDLHDDAVATVEVKGEPVVLELRLGGTVASEARLPEPARRAATRNFWQAWTRTLKLPPMHPELVARSALVIKALCYGPTGAICAAATTSLPEQLGGVRNWDYRFCWIRDACMSAAALVRLGSTGHAMKLLDWLSGIMKDLSTPEQLRPIYTVKGHELGPEGEVSGATGYGDSVPVRVGNGAGNQLQLDVFGIVADLIAILAEAGAPLTPEHIRLLEAIVLAVRTRWSEPDSGIWEIRGPLRHHVHSKTLCWFAVARAIRAREVIGEPVNPEDRQLADAIRDDILSRGFNPKVNSFTLAYGSGEVDAACLLVGLTGLVSPHDPRLLGTIEAVEAELRDGDTVMRYHTDDGLPGTEGGFHLCTGWLIESLHLVGRHADASAWLDRYASQAGPLGLYSEERDPRSGRALGNYPQAYSHLALINACCRLSNR